MEFMFSYASSFNSDISLWNVGSVTNMEQMFLRASSFNQIISKSNLINKSSCSILLFALLCFAFSTNGLSMQFSILYLQAHRHFTPPPRDIIIPPPPFHKLDNPNPCRFTNLLIHGGLAAIHSLLNRAFINNVRYSPTSNAAMAISIVAISVATCPTAQNLATRSFTII